MKKNGSTLAGALIVVAVLALVAIITAAAILVLVLSRRSVDSKKLHEPDWFAVSDYYNFPSADEFEKSPSYSMVWIGESAWIEKKFLLVKANLSHEKYGCTPYLVQALKEVEKKYIIMARTPVRLVHSYLSAITDGLLLELEPK